VAIDLKKKRKKGILFREYLVSCFIIASHYYMFSIQEKVTKTPKNKGLSSKPQGVSGGLIE
jgi:hypothetical protein